ncbi:conserved hypothetical protein [Mesorhizobium prunaredense]|uniref:Uncharacterized protein n=1 Tax=Mesorhizobium prunaredense TaxID=1631249 RepID=A0A1R3VGC1_9HYPH|nr:conserved hypothetical protein [Mesorhizobium prunaredense]
MPGQRKFSSNFRQIRNEAFCNGFVSNPADFLHLSLTIYPSVFIMYFPDVRRIGAIVRGRRAVRPDNAPFTMAAIAKVWRCRPPNICLGPGIDRSCLIHSLNAGCEFQIDKSNLRSRAVHDQVRVR